jgi:hypothetical protein
MRWLVDSRRAQRLLEWHYSSLPPWDQNLVLEAGFEGIAVILLMAARLGFAFLAIDLDNVHWSSV